MGIELSSSLFKDKYKMDLVMTYTSNYSLTLVPYVNTGLTESGNHITQIKSLITKEFNKFIDSKECYMKQIRNALDDPTSKNCGRCANCLGKHFFNK